MSSSSLIVRRCYPRLFSKGFTLVELLTVVAILALLVALSIPASTLLTRRVQQSACAAHLRGIVSATIMFSADNGGGLPLILNDNSFRWSMEILPYIESTSETIKTSQKKIFRCPSDNIIREAAYSNDPVCSYGLNRLVHVKGDTTIKTRKKLYAMPMPLILYGDAWQSANSVPHALSTGSGGLYLDNFHDKKGANYAFTDGHVEFMPLSTVLANNQALLNIP